MANRRTLVLTDDAHRTLENIKAERKDVSYSEIVSEALVNYGVYLKRDYAEEVVQGLIERRLHQMENGLRSLLASASIDISMILVDILEQRKEQKELTGEQVRADFEDLRKAAVEMWKRKRVNQVL